MGQIIPVSPEVCYSFGLARLAKLLWLYYINRDIIGLFRKGFLPEIFVGYLLVICSTKNNFSVIHV